jgi:hypothetical protein
MPWHLGIVKAKLPVGPREKIERRNLFERGTIPRSSTVVNRAGICIQAGSLTWVLSVIEPSPVSRLGTGSASAMSANAGCPIRNFAFFAKI